MKNDVEPIRPAKSLRNRHRRLAFTCLLIVVAGAVVWLSRNAALEALFTLAVAPPLYLVWHFHHADKYKNESFALLIGTFVLGAALAFVAAAVEPPAVPQAAAGTTFLFFLVSVALVEELAKFVAVRILPYRSAKFDEAMDGVIFGVTAALGFATIENIGYVLQYGGALGIFRAFVSVPGHAFYGAIMGYYLAESKVRRKPWLAAWGLLAAVLLHATFDALAFRAGVLALLVLPAFVWFVYFAVVKKEIAKAQRESIYAPR